MGEMVERLAAELYAWEFGCGPGDFARLTVGREDFVTGARRLIQAMREPTEAMCVAIELAPSPSSEELDGTQLTNWGPSWRAAIDAALA